MQIFFCTFLIKLQYVKKVKEVSDKKLPPTTFQAFLKGPKNHIIASGSNKPTLMNDTAWFNQKFQIKSDLLFNPQTHAYNESTLTLEIKCKNRLVTTTHIKSFSLAEVAEKKIVSERDYYMTGGLIANIELSCSEMENKGVKPLRKNGVSSEQVKKNEEEVKSFLLLQTVSFTEEKSNRDTPQFHEQTMKEIEEELEQQPLVLERESDLGPQLRALKQQFQNERKDHGKTKDKLKSTKDLLENEYNTNRELNLRIAQLSKKLQEEKAKCESLQNHLSETQNLCTALSAALSHKETEIIQSQATFDELKRKLSDSTKKNQEAEVLERAKAQLEWEIGVLKKQIEHLKANLSKYFLSDNDMKNEIEKLKGQNAKLKKLKERSQDETSKLAAKEKECQATISKQTQQIDSIKRQTQKWRAEFAIESQRKDQQINHLQQHYSQIFHRYSQIQKKQQSISKLVKKEIYENMKKQYEKKLEQKQEKENKLKQQLEIIEEEILNLQQLLEQKEENEEMLLQHIKKLQNEVEAYAISDRWWSAIIDKHPSPQNADKNDQLSKLQAKNKKLIELLQKNSFTILQGEKSKLQLNNFKKDQEQLVHKMQGLAESQRELKEKIGNLYKQNKKLQQKNANLSREKQALNKKNLWLEEQIMQAKNLQKEARQDYEIVSFQLYKITSKKQKQERMLQSSVQHLAVIRENSEELIASSHKLVRESSIKEKVKNKSEEPLERNVYLQLERLLDERGSQSQEIHSELQRIIAPRLLGNGESLSQDLRRLTIQTSKIKAILIKSGKREYIRQWESVVTSLMSQMQQFITNH